MIPLRLRNPIRAAALGLALLPVAAFAETWVVLGGPHAGTQIEADAGGAVAEEQNESTDAAGEVVDDGDGPRFVGTLFDEDAQDHGAVAPLDGMALGAMSLSIARMRVLAGWAGVESDPQAAKEEIAAAAGLVELLVEGPIAQQEDELPKAFVKKVVKAMEELQELRDAACALIEDDPCATDPRDRSERWIALWGDVSGALEALRKAFEAAVEAAG
ncbi:MAG: hypothetical protein ACF8XB_23490 [Planctomycetota bacterium JB042]